MVDRSEVGNFFIPKFEVFFIGFIFSYFFEECISLLEDLCIFSFDDSKLFKSPFKDRINILSSDTRCKVEKVHLKGPDIYRYVWYFS